MEHYKFDDTGKLINLPSPTSSKADFDFFEGNWTIENKRLKSRLNNCEEWTSFSAEQEMKIVLQGKGNVDHFRSTVDGEYFEGLSLRIFDEMTKLWSIYWTDIHKPGIMDVPVLGSFYGNEGIFYSQDNWEGKDVLVKFIWDKTDPDNPIWSQAFSPDMGETWETNWYMYIKRVV